MSVGRAEDFISAQLSSDELADNVSISESNNKAVLGSIVSVLALGNESFASVIVGFSGPSAFVLGLETAWKR